MRSKIQVPVAKIWPDGAQEIQDWVAVEEPLEIRIVYGPAERRTHKKLSVTMRTPGDDPVLAVGFLLTEGILNQPADVADIQQPEPNVVQVALSPDLRFDPQQLERNFYTTSSCGVCGKTSIEAVQATGVAAIQRPYAALDTDMILSLPARLREAQSNFESTGGIHASALFEVSGALVAVKEDVGRHNALDKLIGDQFLQHRLPLSAYVLLLSGRISFELVQKAARAGIGTVCAVGAPSSLAIETAAQFGMELIGFLRDGRFNRYGVAAKG